MDATHSRHATPVPGFERQGHPAPQDRAFPVATSWGSHPCKEDTSVYCTGAAGSPETIVQERLRLGAAVSWVRFTRWRSPHAFRG